MIVMCAYVCECLVNKTKQSAAAVASSVLAGGNEDEKRNSDFDSQMNFHVSTANNRDLETVLVFTLEDDNEIGILGLLTEEQVRDSLFTFLKLLKTV